MTAPGPLHHNHKTLPEGCNPFCPACPHRTWTEEESLAQKQGFLERSLSPWMDVLAKVRSLSGDGRWRYRNQAVLHCAWNGAWYYGLRSRDEVIPIPGCPVHTESANKAFRELAVVLPGPESLPLKFLVLSGAQLTLVVKSDRLPAIEWMTDELREALAQAGIEGLWIHLHPAAGKRIFGKGGWTLLSGSPRSRDGNGMVYGPVSFQQLIPELYLASLEAASDYLGAGPDAALCDLYCGTGYSMKNWLDQGADVVGVEWSAEALECAEVNAPGATQYQGLCKDRIPQLKVWSELSRKKGRRPLLYLNPPRTGLEEEVMSWICTDYQPGRLAYLSCSPGTLSRDLEKLTANGYSVDHLIPFDFFPQTRHVECLALLAKHQ